MNGKQTRDKPTDFQALYDHLFSDDPKPLTQHQEEKLIRVKAIYPMLLKAESSKKITKMLRKVHDVSEGQAFRDIRLTEQLFGALRRANKEFHRIVIIEMANETFRLGRKQKDVRGMAAALRALIEATGVNIQDPDLPDFEKLDPSLYPTVLDDDIRQLFLDFIDSGGSLDLTKLIEDAEDAQIIEPERLDQEGDQTPPPEK